MFDINGKDNSSYNKDNIEFIKKASPTVGGFIEKEYNRQKNNIELIASENYCSEAVLAACGSCLSWKYAEGYPYVRTSGNTGRYYGGTEFVDELEEYACDVWRKVFDTDYHVNVQPHSGSQANFAAYKAILNPGDTILSLSLDNGGHLTHGSSVNFSGKLYNMVFYDVDEKGYIDMEDVRKKAIEHKPQLILTGASAYSRIIDFPAFAQIAKEVGAYFMVDMAHIAGLVAAGVHPNPVEHAHFVTTTTHKTLRGPRGGMILANEEANKKFNFNKAIFPGSQGGPLEHVIAAKAICFGEALKPEFKTYQEQVLKNAKALAEALKKQGFKILTGGTDNHLMLVDLRGMDVSGKELQNRCDEVYITLNKNTVPNDPRSPFVTSGVRIGTPAITSRGLVESDMDEIARCVWLAATDFENKADEIRASVTEICGRYPIYQ